MPCGYVAATKCYWVNALAPCNVPTKGAGLSERFVAELSPPLLVSRLNRETGAPAAVGQAPRGFKSIFLRIDSALVWL
jgi:hypothetical protein